MRLVTLRMMTVHIVCTDSPLFGELTVAFARSCAALDDLADLLKSTLLPYVINYTSKLQIYSSRIWIQWNDFSDRTLY